MTNMYLGLQLGMENDAPLWFFVVVGLGLGYNISALISGDY